MSQKILFVNPPFTQLNTPYPATAYLKGFLNTRSIRSNQCDLGIEVILSLFSSDGLRSLFQKIETLKPELSENSQRIYNMRDDYIRTIDEVIRFLQEKNRILAHAISDRTFLPEASRFSQTEDLDWAFGTMGIQDKAKHLATLYLEDLSDLIIEAVDPHFGFSRYAERLGRSANSFDELNESLLAPDNFIDEILIDLLRAKVELYQPTVIALSVPFPGNLYSAFKCGQWIKKNHPEIKIVMGGGFPNTELRSLTDSRVFDYLDFITLDDGEAPLLLLLEHLEGKREADQLKRTFICENGQVIYKDSAVERDISQADTGTPDYRDLQLDCYLSVIEIANPMHRLWSDGRWNKLTLAHGCYWGRCTFCDTSLDYIKRYEPSTVKQLCDRMEELIRQTGEIGFHFVDEAAPPALMRSLALEIIRRKLTVVWWTNIRFEKSFTYDLCVLLKESGCIAVSGGLEVASDRLLGMINKGVSLTKVARVTDNFTRSGIMVHAYLMYGFPTQSAQETIDSMDVVRQLFEAGVIQSGFWHQFAMTAHSPVGLHPEKFKVARESTETGSFANNDLVHIDPIGCKHELFSDGLRKSLFNYMHDIGFDLPLQDWFDFKVPRTTVAPDFIQQAIDTQEFEKPSSSASIYWLGGQGSAKYFTKKKKNKQFEMAELTFSNRTNDLVVHLKQEEGKWLMAELAGFSVNHASPKTFSQLETEFEEQTGGDFMLFWNSPSVKNIRKNGLILL
ncbi:B12-binding domain-containing radical SAM protein [Mangrovibacterium lignilyticum]|uniref:B12-binding domain-containing radical SAM protein n=1 Tax=Mangrovibacterium lignilyticum TaxID=2668052 RepID=UPI0013D28FF4|nr:radical SAM protein [Mangrovibacterium lignilyticum]